MATQDVEFAHVNFTLPDGRALLRGITLRVPAGTTTALLGRSGSGKTTLLRTVNGLVRPTAGEVRLGDRVVGGAEEELRALRRVIGYVIQETGLFPHMTVERNIGLGLEVAGGKRAEMTARARELVKLVGLREDVLPRYPWQLSGGQRQRVGLARALATEPEVLLMDEPFGALDPLTRAEMQRMLKDLLARVGVTTLIVTHDLGEALYLANRVVFVEDGQIAADLRADEVRASDIELVKTYVAATLAPIHDDGAVLNGAPGATAGAQA